MVVVEKKGARAINCKSEQTCSALCFFFFVLNLSHLQLRLKNKTKQNQSYCKVQKFILYFSINLERCNELPSFSMLLGKALQVSREPSAIKGSCSLQASQNFSSVLSLYVCVLWNLKMLGGPD